jgi:hypothetical protein
MLVVHHVQSTVQENWCSIRPGHQPRNAEALNREQTFVGVFVDQYSLISMAVHLAENADRMHLPCILKVSNK